MHIPDGIVPLSVAVGGYALSAGLAGYSIRRLRETGDPARGIPRASLMTAAFFTASLVHIPLPPASVHLLLNGLMGAVLGLYAFPAILVGLFFQAVLFGHGGLTTLGLNGVIIGAPAMAASVLFRLRGRGRKKPGIRTTGFCGFLAATAAVSLSVILFALILLGSVPADFSQATRTKALMVLAAAHLPLLLLEGILTALVVMFIERARPDILRDISP